MHPADAPFGVVRVIYENPPIIERAASITAAIPDEVFYSRLETWKEIVREFFPDYDPIQQWMLNFKQEGEVPTLGEAPAQVLVTHRFWKRNAENRRFMSMRILPTRLTLNLHPERNDPHHFEELFNELMTWLPRWASHFGASQFSAVQLDYINLIAAETTPQFVDAKTGSVNIGAVLTVFGGVPGHHEGLVPPYDCQIGVIMDRKRPSILRIRVQGLEFRPKLGAGVRVDFQATTDRSSDPLTATEVGAETKLLHDAIIEKFESVFTDEARASFRPK